MKVSNAQEFLDHLLDEIESNRLVLPSLPEVALRVRDEVERGDINAAKLADMIAEDAALSARLLQVANSPLYRARSEITSLQMAITRMGYNTVRTLLMSLAMQQIFQPTSTLLDSYFHETWQTSVNVAAISRALASLSPKLDPEHGLLAGLIHQIGKLPILTLAEQIPSLANNQASLDPLIEKLHPKIGGVIMKHWNFPDSLYKVATEYPDWHRQPNGDAPDYVDVVQIAYLEHLTSNEEPLPIDPQEMGAFKRLGLAPDINVVEIEDVDAAKQVFA
ncbi:MAG: HDOD domain-containing protein [Methylohalobius sp. ZOD2]